jgi:RimJ/RimL family protein N-acetyltransferase
MRIYLTPVTEADGPMIVKWRNSPQVSKHCFNRNPLSIESNKAFFKAHVETGHYMQYIVNRNEEDYGVASYPIATVYLKDIDKTNRRCELCIFTSSDEEWNTESQTLAIKQLLKIAFRELNMHKVYSFVFSVFKDEYELLEKAGFHKEATLEKEALSPEGEYWDAYRMAIFVDDYMKLFGKELEEEDAQTSAAEQKAEILAALENSGKSAEEVLKFLKS